MIAAQRVSPASALFFIAYSLHAGLATAAAEGGSHAGVDRRRGSQSPADG